MYHSTANNCMEHVPGTAWSRRFVLHKFLINIFHILYDGYLYWIQNSNEENRNTKSFSSRRNKTELIMILYRYRPICEHEVQFQFTTFIFITSFSAIFSSSFVLSQDQTMEKFNFVEQKKRILIVPAWIFHRRAESRISHDIWRIMVDASLLEGNHVPVHSLTHSNTSPQVARTCGVEQRVHYFFLFTCSAYSKKI